MKNLKTFCLVLFISAFLFMVQQSHAVNATSNTDNEKSSNIVAVATNGDSVNSQISEVAGRAPYYLLFDENGVFLKSIKNPSQNRRGGASSVVLNLLLKESVKTVIAGKFGNKMKNKLKANRIEYHIDSGIAKEVVKKIIEDKRSKNE